MPLQLFIRFMKVKIHPLRLFGTVFVWGILVMGVCGLGGCASSPKRESDDVSTIPWNRPASWEGRGPLGGMMMMEGR